MDHKVERAKRLIDDVFSDTSVPPETTAERLVALKGEIEERLQCLRDDGVEVPHGW